MRKLAVLLGALALLATGLMANKCTFNNTTTTPACSDYTSQSSCSADKACHWNNANGKCNSGAPTTP